MLKFWQKNLACPIMLDNPVYFHLYNTSPWTFLPNNLSWIFQVLFIFRFPSSKTAPALRKAQASKMAFKHVATGIKHFKANNHVEAFQCLNQVQEFPMKSKNVTCLIWAPFFQGTSNWSWKCRSSGGQRGFVCQQIQFGNSHQGFRSCFETQCISQERAKIHVRNSFCTRKVKFRTFKVL